MGSIDMHAFGSGFRCFCGIDLFSFVFLGHSLGYVFGSCTGEFRRHQSKYVTYLNFDMDRQNSRQQRAGLEEPWLYALQVV